MPSDGELSIGFTGTQVGMTSPQVLEVERILVDALRDGNSGMAHHGDCVGADAEFDLISRWKGYKVTLHPPENTSKQANCAVEGDQSEDPKPYLDRNRDIVDSCDFLIATPATKQEVRRSGTWYTVRYARKCKKTILLVFPDGEVKTEAAS